jgi:nucleoside-diphosphate-sugar epimerase
VLRLPVGAYYTLGLISEMLANLRHKEPETTRYRIRARLTRVQWDCSKAKHILRWRPRIPLRDALESSFRRHATAA